MTKVDEAIERLRGRLEYPYPGKLPTEAMTDIRALLAEVERLREALTGLTDAVTREVNSSDHRGGSGFLLARLADARAALQPQKVK